MTRDGRHGVKRSRQQPNMTLLEKTQALPFEAADSYEELQTKVMTFDSITATDEDVATCECITWNGPEIFSCVKDAHIIRRYAAKVLRTICVRFTETQATVTVLLFENWEKI